MHVPGGRHAFVFLAIVSLEACVLESDSAAGTTEPASRPSLAAGRIRSASGSTVSADRGDRCAARDAEPNDRRADAVVLDTPTDAVGCYEADTGVDYYLFQAPAEQALAEGYFTGEVISANTPMGARIYTRADGARILQSSLGAGLKRFSIASAPGAQFLAEITPGSAGNDGPYEYTLTLDFTPVDDAFEPNDARDQAQPIELNEPIEAYLFAGYETSAAPNADDWYSVQLASGQVSIAVDPVPESISVRVELFDSKNASVGVSAGQSRNLGASIDATAMIQTGGPCKVRVSLAAGRLAGEGGAPDHFDTPYGLTISQ